VFVRMSVGMSAHGNAVSSCRHVIQLRDSFLKAVKSLIRLAILYATVAIAQV
jgi:hypothetical protein